jgi:hypothetical protein
MVISHLFINNGIKVKRLQLNIVLLLMLVLCRISDSFAEGSSIPPSYHWGRGISWPDAHFNLGGYGNLGYEHPERQINQLVLEELSLFLTWSPHQRLRFFSEVEVDDLLSTASIARLSDSLRAERLFVDVLVSETTTVRIGKFLSPIGRWNVIHAAPLTWTATRPVVSDDRLFSPHLNGVMLTQRLQIGESNFDLSFYADHSSEFDVFDNSTTGFDTAFGGRINLETGNAWQVGLSYTNFSNEITPKLDRNDLLGVDFIWKENGYEAMAEAIYRHASDSQGQEQGFYTQGVIPLSEQFSAVARYEYINGTHHFVTSENHIGIAGLAWRPYVPLVFKAEYRFGASNDAIAPSGFFASISTLF